MYRYTTGRLWSCRSKSLNTFLCLIALALAEGMYGQAAPERPAPLWVRSLSELSSGHSLPGSAVEVVVTQGYLSPGGFVIPVGSVVRGRVVETSRAKNSSLALAFDSIAVTGIVFPFQARVLDVDNARERVETNGTILGLDELRKKPGKLELILLAAAYAHPALAVSLETTKYVIREIEKPKIFYPAGTDISLAIEAFPTGSSPARMETADAQTLGPLSALLNALPNRTRAKHSGEESDWVNLALLGSRESLTRAFDAAGWRTAEQLSITTDARAFFAVLDHHSYKIAPVSTLLLAGRMPDLVYQKQTNTFAKRHHIRIWASDQTWDGQPVWIASATHDVGIDFSVKARTFTHRVDNNVDLERMKVVSDLRFSGHITSVSYLSRPSVPHQSQNATGDTLYTDGRLAVLELAR